MLDARYSMEVRTSEPTELHLSSIEHPVSSIEIQHRVSSIEYLCKVPYYGYLEGNRTDDLINDGNNLQPGSVK